MDFSFHKYYTFLLYKLLQVLFEYTRLAFSGIPLASTGASSLCRNLKLVLKCTRNFAIRTAVNIEDCGNSLELYFKNCSLKVSLEQLH